MKRAVMTLLHVVLLAGTSLLPFTATAQPRTINGTWQGSATVHGQQVPVTFQLSGSSSVPVGALLDGPESSVASSTSVAGGHIQLIFADYARTLELDTVDGKLVGSFGTKKVRYPVTLSPAVAHGRDTCGPYTGVFSIAGSWEVAVNSAKGETAWQLEISHPGTDARAVIQRIDGDTGSLYQACVPTDRSTYLFSHFNADGAALYSVVPQSDGTLLVSNLLRADRKPAPDQQNLIARRPASARAANLPAPTLPTDQTRMKNPAEPLRFSAPDLTGRLVSNTDLQFDGKVVLVTVGGSWCPNCHDEAPDLEKMYQDLHARGLEIVDLSFEEDDQLKDPSRLRAFIASAGITYTVLLVGNTDQLNEKMPQAENLNCWPTSFFVDRTGHVRLIHAGYSGPATGKAHTDLVAEMTHRLEELLAEPGPTREAAVAP